jgi:uncharacterized protein YciI
MKHWLLFYEAADDYAAKRAPHRGVHLAKAREAVARGELVLGGALADPLDGSVLLFKAPTRETAEAFAASDPYVLHGVVARWHVREWTTVVGPEALTVVP